MQLQSLRKPNNPPVKIYWRISKNLNIDLHGTQTPAQITIYSNAIKPHLNIYKRGTEREKEEKNISQKQHPEVLKKGRRKDKKDEKMGLTKGGGFDIIAKLTWGTELLWKRKMMKIIEIKCDAPWKLNND